jgi:hypothetical protein
MTTGLRESRPLRRVLRALRRLRIITVRSLREFASLFFGEEARGALWTGIGCMVLSAVIVFGFLMMVIHELPDP